MIVKRNKLAFSLKKWKRTRDRNRHIAVVCRMEQDRFRAAKPYMESRAKSADMRADRATQNIARLLAYKEGKRLPLFGRRHDAKGQLYLFQ